MQSAGNDPEAPRQLRRVPWATFDREIVATMRPGDHVSLIGPTGQGKSTLALHMLKRRPYVVVLDAKGGDDTLNGSGFEVVHQWPIPNEGERISEGKPIRVLLRPQGHGRQRLDQAHELFERAITGALDAQQWTVYVDELRLTAEGRTIDLAPNVEVAYMTGRGRRVTMISATQAPRWIPRAAYDQATHQFHWPLRDRDGRARQAEIAGIDRREFEGLCAGLADFHVLYVPPRGDPVCVKPPAPAKPRRPVERQGQGRPTRTRSALGRKLWGGE